MQALEDLIVQTEIFLQYSLQNKAMDRLQKIADCFPGKKKKTRGCRICMKPANWWPQGNAGQRNSSRQLQTAAPAACRKLRSRVRQKPERTTRTHCAIFRKYRRSIRKFSGSRHRGRC